MIAEIDQINKMHTFNIVKMDPCAISNIINSMIVLQRKHNAQGLIAKFKARLVAKGFGQRKGIDSNDTFALVVRGTTLQFLLSLAASIDAAVKQGDAKNA